MPTYDYICKACDKTFEIFHSMKDPARTECPDCGEPSLEKQIGTGAGIIFKGSGFYETDYKKTAADKGKDAASDSKPATNTETKPAKPESATTKSEPQSTAK